MNSLLPDGAEAATQFMPPSVDGWADDVTTYEYDPERAKSLLAEAGATGTTLRFFYPTDVSRPYLPDPAAMFEVINKNLTDAGFTVAADLAAVEPGLPRRGRAPAAPTSTSSGGPATTTTPTTSSARSSPTPVAARPRRSSAGSSRRRSSRPWRPADAEPDASARTELYQEANRVIMDFLPRCRSRTARNALVVAENVDGSGAQPAVSRGLLDRHHQRLTQVVGPRRRRHVPPPASVRPAAERLS